MKPTALFRSFLALALCCAALAAQAQTAQYHLIAGSFDTFQTASDFAGGLKGANGMNPQVLMPDASTPKYRVSVYHSSNRTEVQSFQNGLKSKGLGKGYWVLAQQGPATSVAAAGTRPAAGTASGKPVYHLIVSSFDDLAPANQALNTLRAEGFTPYLLYPKGKEKGYRVSVYQADNKREVQSFSSFLKKRGKPAGWVYEEPAGSAAAVPPGANARMGAPAGTATYHLIGGSFARFDQASDYANTVRPLGYDPLILFPEATDGGKFRVSLYRSTSRTEVEAYKKQKNNTTAWVLEVK
ncbi:MAG: SPOR domain-containing protein [Bacteroidia bacterium]|nr:SPOR domain-containing protein [Bacteroidia bacterium]